MMLIPLQAFTRKARERGPGIGAGASRKVLENSSSRRRAAKKPPAASPFPAMGRQVLMPVRTAAAREHSLAICQGYWDKRLHPI